METTKFFLEIRYSQSTETQVGENQKRSELGTVKNLTVLILNKSRSIDVYNEIGLLVFLVVHREKHDFDNMSRNEQNESKIKKEIFLELEIQRVIRQDFFSLLQSKYFLSQISEGNKNRKFVSMCTSMLTYTLLQTSEATVSIKMKTTLKITECGSKKIWSKIGL